jgi:repressor LexA
MNPKLGEIEEMKDAERFNLLKKYYKEHCVLPSYSTIAKLVGYQSKSSVASFVDKLKSRGHLDETPEGQIKPGPLFKMKYLDKPLASNPL